MCCLNAYNNIWELLLILRERHSFKDEVRVITLEYHPQWLVAIHPSSQSCSRSLLTRSNLIIKHSKRVFRFLKTYAVRRLLVHGLWLFDQANLKWSCPNTLLGTLCVSASIVIRCFWLWPHLLGFYITLADRLSHLHMRNIRSSVNA